jgi:hypothetical protein
MPIDLPKTPSGEQYEDYVAATLRANGYFTESRVVLRENGSEILARPSGPAERTAGWLLARSGAEAPRLALRDGDTPLAKLP